ncbi:MAG: copper resistance CopC family protein [Gemmatimonadota bacterium]
MMSRLLLSVATAGALATGWFHVELKSSLPEKNSRGAAPAKVSLTFSEEVNSAVSAISILKSDSTELSKLVVKPTKNAATIEAAIPVRLAPGSYLVRWRTASDDGHAVRGTYAFTVAPSQ